MAQREFAAAAGGSNVVEVGAAGARGEVCRQVAQRKFAAAARSGDMIEVGAGRFAGGCL